MAGEKLPEFVMYTSELNRWRLASSVFEKEKQYV
jgi:hypothetical protein